MNKLHRLMFGALLWTGCETSKKETAGDGAGAGTNVPGGVTGTMTVRGKEHTTLSGVAYYSEFEDDVLLLGLVPWAGSSCANGNWKDKWLQFEGREGQIYVEIVLESPMDTGDTWWTGNEAWEWQGDGSSNIEDGLNVTLSDVNMTTPEAGDRISGSTSFVGQYHGTVEGQASFNVQFCE